MTVLRWYVALGLLGCLVFGGSSIWLENRERRGTLPLQILTLLCLPALLVAAVVIAIGSIGLG